MKYVLQVILLVALGGAAAQQFSCRGRLAGGYYGDTATQCRDFHVCVRAAGAVTAFRFSCPEGTAFHQQAQTCTEWSELGCPDSSFGDSFDIYRLGGGYENKKVTRPPVEEEPEFPLQRADSDLRAEHSSDFFSGSRREYYNRRSTASTATVTTTAVPPPPPTQQYQNYPKRKLVRKLQRRPIEQPTTLQPSSQPAYFNQQPYRPQPKSEAPRPPFAPAIKQDYNPEFTVPASEFKAPKPQPKNEASRPPFAPVIKQDYTPEFRPPAPEFKAPRPQPKSEPPRPSFAQEHTPEFRPPTPEFRAPTTEFRASTSPAPAKQFKNSYAPSDTFRISPQVPSAPTSPAPPKKPSTIRPFDKPVGASFRVAPISPTTNPAPQTYRPSTLAYRAFTYSPTAPPPPPSVPSPTPIVSEYSVKGFGKTGTPNKYYSTTPQYDSGRERNSLDQGLKFSSSAAPTQRRDFEPVSFNKINNLQSTPSYIHNDVTQEEDDGQWRPSPDEDDGQWRPDIYDRPDERQDELLTAAHSINIAASKNKLHHDSRPKPFSTKPQVIVQEQKKSVIKEEPRGFTQPAKTLSTPVIHPQVSLAPQAPSPPPSPKPTTYAPPPAPRPTQTQPPIIIPNYPKKSSAPHKKVPAQENKPKQTKNEDASYDYAYYDSSDPYTEYDQIEDFGKTGVRKS